MGCQKSCDLFFVLFVQDGAGRINQPPTGLHKARRTGKDARLQGNKTAQPQVWHPPTGIGIAPPCARAAARRIDQDVIEAALVTLDPRVSFAGQHPCFYIVQPRAAQALGAAFQARFVDVAGDEMAFVLHLRGDCQEGRVARQL